MLFCALLIVPQRDGGYIAAAFAAHVIAELGVGMPVPQLLLAFVTVAVALLSAMPAHFVGEPPWFGNFHKAYTYIVITAGISPVSALGGAFVPIVRRAVADYWIFWSHWYLANALPNLTLGPVFLICFSDRASWTRWTLARADIEPAVLGILAGVCVIAAAASARLTSGNLLPAVLFLPLPLVLWAAIRFGEKARAGHPHRRRHPDGNVARPRSVPDIGPERGVLARRCFDRVPVLLLGLDRRAAGAERNDTVAELRRQEDELAARSIRIAGYTEVGDDKFAFRVGSSPAAVRTRAR